MFKIVAFAAALVATAATVSFPAQAAELPTLRVRYSDLSLSSASGAAELKNRVRRAAKRVCAVQGDKSLVVAQMARECAEIAEARAMPQVELALANAGTQVAENSRISVAAH